VDGTQAVDICCDPTATDLWNDPFNAWSNHAFGIAAGWGAVEAAS